MLELIIVRHGKTDWNVKGLVQGRSDIELNEEGIVDAKELAKKLKEENIDVCICSPLKRARKTAEILVDKSKIIIDDQIIERNFGDLEGLEINFDILNKLWDYNLNYKLNNVETIKECLERARVFINKLKENYDNKKILIVTHGAFLKALHLNLIGYDSNTDFLSFNPKNTTIYKYSLK